MNRTKIKNYAPQARRDFLQAVKDRAAFYGLTADRIEPVTAQGAGAVYFAALLMRLAST